MPRTSSIAGPAGGVGPPGSPGPSGAMPTATLTAPYLVASGATVLTVSDATDLLVGTYAQVTDGTQVLTGKITAKTSLTSITFTPLASRPTNEPANGYSFVATTSFVTVGGAQGPTGLQGTQGIPGTNGTNGVPVSTLSTAALTVLTTSMTIAVVDSTGFQINQQVFVGDGTTAVYGKITSKASSTSITFTPDLGPSVATTGTIASGAQVIPASAQGAGGAQGVQGIPGTNGTNGTNGVNGATPLTLTTASYTSATSGVAIAVTANSTGAFAVGQNATVTNAAGTSRTTGTITAVAASSITFQAYATTPPGDAVTGTVYAIGSTLAVSGAQGATGASGSTLTSSFRAYQSTGQGAIAASTATKISLQTKVYDGNTEFSTTTFRFTAGATGVYAFSACVNISNSANTDNYAMLYVNGALHTTLGYGSTAGANPIVSGSTQIKLNAGDFVELYAQGSGAPTINGSILNTYFSGARIQ